MSEELPLEPPPPAAPAVDPYERARVAEAARAERELEDYRAPDPVAELEELRQADAPPPPQLISDADLHAALATLWGAVGAILGARLGPKWNLTQQEAAALASGWAPIARMYLPEELSGPWVMALGTTAIVFLPRLQAEVNGPPPEEQKAAPVSAAA